MKHSTNSPDYRTVRQAWPEGLVRECPYCDAPVTFLYADDGKIVHELDEDIYQVRDLYACTNPCCYLHHHPFNPHPRLDYSGRHYGVGVLRFVAEEFLLYEATPKQIHARLTRKHAVEISRQTVARICDDVLLLKAYQVDEHTREMLQRNPRVLLGMDGQDPRGETTKVLWLFIDLLTGRVLFTCIVESMDHTRLHEVIEEIVAELGIEIIGFVSDKQRSITKCVEKYYPGIPHQYCQFHFLRNTWNHLEALDSEVFLPLKKVINKLYIHSVAPSVKVDLGAAGRLPVREVFKPVDEDLQVMLRARNVTLKTLRGIQLFEQLGKYVTGMEVKLRGVDPDHRATHILRRTAEALRAGLAGVQETYEATRTLAGYFEEIREVLAVVERHWLDQQVSLDEVYARVWMEAVERGLERDLPELRSFMPAKGTSVATILGEWCRLWESYRDGLFQYRHFPEPVRTNNGCEGAFSKEKHKIFRRAAKTRVGHLVETRGEAYLRLVHCEDGEIEADLVETCTRDLLRDLRGQLQARIRGRTRLWRSGTRANLGYEEVLYRLFPGLVEPSEALLEWIQVEN